MRNVVEQLMQCKSQVEVHEITAKSLQEAEGALNEIEATMINVGEFWKEVEGVCEKVTGRSLKKQVDMLSTKKPHERKSIWKSKAFKVNALNFYGKWIALKEACANASANVDGALKEVQRYMVENPNERKAFESLQQMGVNFLEELQDKESHDKELQAIEMIDRDA